LKRLTRHGVQENKVRSVKNTLAKGLVVTENSKTPIMLALVDYKNMFKTI